VPELVETLERWQWQGPGVWIGVDEEKLASHPGVFEASVRAVERHGDIVDVRHLNTELQPVGLKWQIPQKVSRVVGELNGLKKHVVRGGA